MKEKIAALTLLIIISIAVITNTLTLEKQIKSIESEISRIDIYLQDSENELREIYERYKKKSNYFGLTVSHEDLMNIEETFVETIAYIDIGDTNSAMVAKSRLEYFLKHLRRLSGLNIDSII